MEHPPFVCGEGAADIPGALTFEGITRLTPFAPAALLSNGSLLREGDFAYYNSVKGVSLEQLLDQGAAVQEQLQLTAEDTICLPITLNHSMGMGLGVMAALQSDAAVVLPNHNGPDADSTLSALSEERCTILFADTHTYKNLPVDASMPLLRAGLVKVGSGEQFGLGDVHSFGGCELTTVGKPR
eukprot:TRINITY_DN33122_c0_g1_i2.p2 TRINITY_DN33122_c0_g1~~TRINITY_DN33122_c0_g1_i2.p2  ORF type:complete len:184 (+),score=54.78 TRINITY_DN33122_c0_g1_i2:379-930(+)